MAYIGAGIMRRGSLENRVTSKLFDIISKKDGEYWTYNEFPEKDGKIQCNSSTYKAIGRLKRDKLIQDVDDYAKKGGIRIIYRIEMSEVTKTLNSKLRQKMTSYEKRTLTLFLKSDAFRKNRVFSDDDFNRFTYMDRLIIILQMISVLLLKPMNNEMSYFYNFVSRLKNIKGRTSHDEYGIGPLVQKANKMPESLLKKFLKMENPIPGLERCFENVIENENQKRKTAMETVIHEQEIFSALTRRMEDRKLEGVSKDLEKICKKLERQNQTK